MHQICSVIIDDNDNEIDSINLKFVPRFLHYTEEALSKSHLTYEEVYGRFLNSNAAFETYAEFLERHVNRYDPKDKMQFVAYNVDFDENVTRRWFDNSKTQRMYGSYFWTPGICLMRQAAWLMRNQRVVHNFKLATICKFAGIEFEEEEAHDALYDVRKMIELYKKLV